MEPDISKQGRWRTMKSNCGKYIIYSEEMKTGRDSVMLTYSMLNVDLLPPLCNK